MSGEHDHGPEVDSVTGVETTGHEWDGIKELNKPLPKWWLWIFYISIVWSIGYWVLYPAWPTANGYTQGILGYSQRSVVMNAVEAGHAAQGKFREAIASKDVSEIIEDPELLRFAVAGGDAMFGEKCSACHGRGAQGGVGYPNLNDDEWIWGGSIDAIYHTIKHGIRADNDDTRFGNMPAFGNDQILEPQQIQDVTSYVLTLSGQAQSSDASTRGEQVFLEQCAACHGENGKGMAELGAPNLTDQIWLYGSDRETIVSTIQNGRAGMMPAWGDRLDPVTVKSLAVYVHSLGGGG